MQACFHFIASIIVMRAHQLQIEFIVLWSMYDNNKLIDKRNNFVDSWCRSCCKNTTDESHFQCTSKLKLFFDWIDTTVILQLKVPFDNKIYILTFILYFSLNKKENYVILIRISVCNNSILYLTLHLTVNKLNCWTIPWNMGRNFVMTNDTKVKRGNKW